MKLNFASKLSITISFVGSIANVMNAAVFGSEIHGDVDGALAVIATTMSVGGCVCALIWYQPEENHARVAVQEIATGRLNV